MRRGDTRRGTRPWDRKFAAWIAQARERGVDPNDIGDLVWADDNLAQSLDRHYLPTVSPDAVVLELGPGTGRLTRHLVGRCREVVLADYSELVCEWLHEYLRSRGRYRIVHLTGPVLTDVASASVDAVLAHGVFEHIDLDDMAAFLDEFRRVLKPRGAVVFNFDNFMSPGGQQWFTRWRPSPGQRGIFRFYHPDVVRTAAQASGFDVEEIAVDDSRLATAKLRKR